jgi:hypothetical protein
MRVSGVIIPALEEGTTVKIHVAEEEGGTYVPVQLEDRSGDWVFPDTGSTAGGVAVTCFEAAPFQFFRIVLGTAQNIDKDFFFIGRD